MERVTAGLDTVLSYSVAYTHMKQVLGGLLWAVKSSRLGSASRVAVANHLVAAALDSLLGALLLQWTLARASPRELVEAVTNATDEGVVQLRSLLNFLMGSPGGLKLNLPFNIALGQFFTYNTNLWWVFLDQCQPLLVLACQAIEWLGLFGVTTHLAIVSDLLSLASFHAYCIYVYAARLFSLQIRGLVTLWRLFLGRKWNPLRQCVDSCDYEPSQLFAGVLAFTVLLFLLPTTMVYYAVFASLRVLFMVIEGLLFRLRSLVQTLPVVAVTLWILGCRVIRSNVSMRLAPPTKPGEPPQLQMHPERASLGAVIHMAVDPVPLPKPPPVEWMKYMRNIATGMLF